MPRAETPSKKGKKKPPAKPAKKKAPKKKAPKRKRGQPSKFDKLTKAQIKTIALMFQRGFTDLEVAQMLGVTRNTILNWRNSNPDFLGTTKKSKAQANAEVKQALFERATGYSHPDTKAQWVESDVLVEGEGIVSVGRWEYAELIKHYPPDTAAGFIWLKNRGSVDEEGNPEEWRDKPEPGDSSLEPEKISVTIEVKDASKKPEEEPEGA